MFLRKKQKITLKQISAETLQFIISCVIAFGVGICVIAQFAAVLAGLLWIFFGWLFIGALSSIVSSLCTIILCCGWATTWIILVGFMNKGKIWKL